MLDFFAQIGQIIENIFGFFRTVIDAITGYIESVKAWWEILFTILEAFPASVLVIVGAAFTLLVVFIVIELLRDFL